MLRVNTCNETAAGFSTLDLKSADAPDPSSPNCELKLYIDIMLLIDA